jgi:hypothetical protein
MSKRTEITDTLKRDLLKVSVSNGYFHDIEKVIPMFRTPDDFNELPAVCVVAGDEEITAGLEDENVSENSLEVVIMTHMEVTNDWDFSGKFTDEAERWIDDYRKFVHSINPAAGCAVGFLDGVTHCYISRIEPYSDWRDNKQTLVIRVTVKYICTT